MRSFAFAALELDFYSPSIARRFQIEHG